MAGILGGYYRLRLISEDGDPHFPDSGTRGKYQVPTWNGVCPRQNGCWDYSHGTASKVLT